MRLESGERDQDEALALSHDIPGMVDPFGRMVGPLSRLRFSRKASKFHKKELLLEKRIPRCRAHTRLHRHGARHQKVRMLVTAHGHDSRAQPRAASQPLAATSKPSQSAAYAMRGVYAHASTLSETLSQSVGPHGGTAGEAESGS